VNPRRLRQKLRHDPCDLLDMVLRESPGAAGAMIDSVGRDRIVSEVRQSFLDWDYLGETLELLGESRPAPNAKQRDIDECLLTLANGCHRTLLDLDEKDSVRTWLRERGVTERQIRKHRLGVFGGVTQQEMAILLGKHPPECVAAVLSWRPLFGLSAMAAESGEPYMTYVTFPEIERGRLHNLCLRALGQSLVSKFFFSHGRQMTFNRGHGHNDAILVEGVFDVLALERAGIENAVGLGSCHLTARHAARLSGFARILLAFDGDDAGAAGMRRASLDYGSRFSESVTVPNGLDPDEYLRAGGDPGIFD